MRRGVTLRNRPQTGRMPHNFAGSQTQQFLDACSPRPYGPRGFREGFPAQALGGAQPLGPNDPADDEERLDELGRRIDAAREQSSSQEAKPVAEPSGRLNVVYRVSTEFVAAVFLGIALGLGFDYLTGWKPTGILLGSFLGIAAAFYTVIRTMRQLNAENDKTGK